MRVKTILHKSINILVVLAMMLVTLPMGGTIADTPPENEVDALEWVQENTTLTSVSGTIADLKASFPDVIPPVIVGEPYVIDSRITLDDELPKGTTVTVFREESAVLEDIVLSGKGPFFFTEMFDPVAPNADFDADYGGAVENYAIILNVKVPFDFSTKALIESVISKDEYATETVLADIILDVDIPADEEAALVWVQENTHLTSVSGRITDLEATFPDVIPPVIVAEEYVIDSRITLDEELPDGTTVTIQRNEQVILPGITLSGTGPFWFTELFEPDAPRAAFNDNYAGLIEDYVITLDGLVAVDFSTEATIESVISKDGYNTQTVLGVIDLLADIPAAPNTLDDEIESAPRYPYDPPYVYEGDWTFDANKKTFTATYTMLTFDPGAMNDLARYLGALHRQEGSTINLISYGEDDYIWYVLGDEELKGSNWRNAEEDNDETLVSVIVADYLSDPGPIAIMVSDGVHNADVIFILQVKSTLDDEIASAPDYEYDPPYEYVGEWEFDGDSNTFTAVYTAPEFITDGAMNDLARYLGALYRQEGSTINLISYGEDDYIWYVLGDEELKGSNWRNAKEDNDETLVSVIVADYLEEPGPITITVSDGVHNADVIFILQVISTLDDEIVSAPDYKYEPAYEYVGEWEFDGDSNTFTAVYTAPEFITDGAMNDLARYLGALYRQDDATIIAIEYNSVTYTWNKDRELKGSNWEAADSTTLVSAIVAAYQAEPVLPWEVKIRVSDGLHFADVTFELQIKSTLDEEIESAPDYEYEPAYEYVGDWEFDGDSNTFTAVYTTLTFEPGAMFDLARYLGALYRQVNSTIIEIAYDSVIYTWNVAGTLLGSNWEDDEGTTLMSVIVADYQVEPGPITITVSDRLYFADVTFLLEIIKASQTIEITESAPESAVYDETFTVAAIASSELPVTYSSGSPDICTVTGDTFTMVSGTGVCVVQYDQAGNNDYNAAEQVTEEVNATKASQTIEITESAPVSAVYDETFTVAATASSGLPVTYSSGNTDICTVDGAEFTMVSGTGTCVVQYDQAGDGNYSAAPQVTEDVNATKATASVTLENLNQTYDGNTKAASATTVPAGLTVNFVYNPPNPVNVGSYQVTATIEDDNYEGSSTGTLVISKATATVTLGNLNQTYDGNIKEASAITVPEGLKVIIEYDPPDPVNAGSYLVTATVDDPNYMGSATGILNISALPITISADNQTKIIGQDDPELTYQITAGELVAGDEIEGELTRDAGEDVGTYPIRRGSLDIEDGNEGNNYALTFVNGIFTITSKPVTTITVTADPEQTKVYGNPDPLSFTYTSTHPDVPLTGALARIPGEKVGEYTITQGTLAVEDEDYVISFVSAIFTITPRPITITAHDRSKEYGGEDPALTYTQTGSLAFNDTIEGALTRAEGENIGTYGIMQGSLVIVDGNNGDNYDLTFVESTLTITPRPITITADDQSKIYGEDDPDLTYAITGLLAFDDEITGGLTRDEGEDVGAYDILQGAMAIDDGNDGDNYDLTFVPGTLTITTRPITITADDKSIVFGEDDPELTYDITAGSLAFEDEIIGELFREAGEDVGEYDITQGSLVIDDGNEGENYDLTFVEGTLTIEPRLITLSAIEGVTPPSSGETPVTVITETDEYTGSVTWLPEDEVFEPGTVYTATITLTPKTGYTLIGVAEDFFTVDEAASVTNEADSGEVEAIFPQIPVAEDDLYIMGLETEISIDAPGVLANDSADNGADLKAFLVDELNPLDPDVGDLTLEEDGSFTFTHGDDWDGKATFTYIACDGEICSAPATVTIEESDSCLVVAPEILELTLQPDSTDTLDLVLTNICDVDINYYEDWLFHEREGFEGGIMPPRGGWESFHRGSTIWRWRIVDNPEWVDEGRYAAWANFDNDKLSDEWLLTPVLNTSDLTDLVLSFRAYSNTKFPGATMKVWVTNEVGVPITTFSDTPLWDLIRDEVWESLAYRSVQVDLREFDEFDGKIRIAWQYFGQGGQSFGLDEIEISYISETLWLSTNSTEEILPARGEQNVEVNFNTNDMVFGDYYADILLGSEPYPVISIPVVLHVSPQIANNYYLPLITR